MSVRNVRLLYAFVLSDEAWRQHVVFCCGCQPDREHLPMRAPLARWTSAHWSLRWEGFVRRDKGTVAPPAATRTPLPPWYGAFRRPPADCWPVNELALVSTRLCAISFIVTALESTDQQSHMVRRMIFTARRYASAVYAVYGRLDVITQAFWNGIFVRLCSCWHDVCWQLHARCLCGSFAALQICLYRLLTEPTQSLSYCIWIDVSCSQVKSSRLLINFAAKVAVCVSD